jgi:hypothetical protein
MTTVSTCMVFAASEGVRPVTATDGCVELLETLYPRAISPAWSIAMLPIQRKSAFGAKVLSCARLTDPLGFWSSYHRTPPLLLTATE